MFQGFGNKKRVVKKENWFSDNSCVRKSVLQGRTKESNVGLAASDEGEQTCKEPFFRTVDVRQRPLLGSQRPYFFLESLPSPSFSNGGLIFD